MIRVGGTIYGASGHDGPAPITAFDVKTGQVRWHSGREFAKAQLLYADGKLIVLDEDGVLALTTSDAQGAHSPVQSAAADQGGVDPAGAGGSELQSGQKDG